MPMPDKPKTEGWTFDKYFLEYKNKLLLSEKSSPEGILLAHHIDRMSKAKILFFGDKLVGLDGPTKDELLRRCMEVIYTQPDIYTRPDITRYFSESRSIQLVIHMASSINTCFIDISDSIHWSLELNEGANMHLPHSIREAFSQDGVYLDILDGLPNVCRDNFLVSPYARKRWTENALSYDRCHNVPMPTDLIDQVMLSPRVDYIDAYSGYIPEYDAPCDHIYLNYDAYPVCMRPNVTPVQVMEELTRRLNDEAERGVYTPEPCFQPCGYYDDDRIQELEEMERSDPEWHIDEEELPQSYSGFDFSSVRDYLARYAVES